MWKLCLINVVNERNMLRTDKDLESVWFWAFRYWFLIPLLKYLQIELRFKPENAKTALQCLKQFVLQAKLSELYVNRHIRSEILETFLELLAEKSFKEIILLGDRQAKTFDL